MKKVFIDGSSGTTGLRIRDRLAQRDDIKLIELPEEKRKDTQARRKALNSADISFLCLPDAAAIEAAELVENENTVILDTSTAHRTAPGWAYGFPELSAEFEAKIISSKRIAVPGCHASGFIALVYPLIEAGLLGKGRSFELHLADGLQRRRHDTQSRMLHKRGQMGRAEGVHHRRAYPARNTHRNAHRRGHRHHVH